MEDREKNLEERIIKLAKTRKRAVDLFAVTVSH